MIACVGVRQPDLEMGLADMAIKDNRVSNFKRLTAYFEDDARQKAVLAQNKEWNNIEKHLQTGQDKHGMLSLICTLT